MLNWSPFGDPATKSPVTEGGRCRASKDFSERISELEYSWNTYKFGEATTMVLAYKHIAQVEMLDTVVTTVITRKFFTSLIVFKDSGRPCLRKPQVSEQPT